MTNGDIAHNEQITHFVTMFSTLFDNCTFIAGYISYVYIYVFRVACCRFAIRMKGLTHHTFVYYHTNDDSFDRGYMNILARQLHSKLPISKISNYLP